MIKKINIGIIVIMFFIFSVNYSAFAQKLYIISGSNYVGCTNKKYYEKLVNYAVQNDLVAFKKALTIGILTGMCTIFKYGEKVYITDVSIFSGLIKVRRPGEIIEYWTVPEAVK